MGEASTLPQESPKLLTPDKADIKAIRSFCRAKCLAERRPCWRSFCWCCCT